MELLLAERLQNVHALGQGKGRQYADERKKLLSGAEQCFIAGTPKGEEAPALIWSLLLWSDPGQVLWESPIVTVRASGLEADITQKGTFVRTMKEDSEEKLWEQLLGSENIKPMKKALDARRSSVRDRI